MSWEEATDEECDLHLSQTREGSWVESSRPGDQAIVQSMVEAGNNVGSDSHKLGGSCCGSAGCYAVIVSRIHDVRSAQGDEKGDCERSESNLKETQNDHERVRLNYVPPEHESTRWSTIGVGVERAGVTSRGNGCHGLVGGCDSTECCSAATNCSATPINKLRYKWVDDAVTRVSTTKTKVGSLDIGITTWKEGVLWEHTSNDRRNQIFPKLNAGGSQRVVRSMSTRTRILRQDARESTSPGAHATGMFCSITPEGLVVRKAREFGRAGFLNTNHANR